MSNTSNSVRVYPPAQQGCFYMSFGDLGTGVSSGLLYPSGGSGDTTATVGDRLELTLDGISSSSDCEVEVVSVTMAGGVTSCIINGIAGVAAEGITMACTATVGGVTHNPGVRLLGGISMQATVTAGFITVGFRVHKYSRAS